MSLDIKCLTPDAPLFVSRNSTKGHKAMVWPPIAKAIGHSDVATTLRYYVDACLPAGPDLCMSIVGAGRCFLKI